MIWPQAFLQWLHWDSQTSWVRITNCTFCKYLTSKYKKVNNTVIIDMKGYQAHSNYYRSESSTYILLLHRRDSDSMAQVSSPLIESSKPVSVQHSSVTFPGNFNDRMFSRTSWWSTTCSMHICACTFLGLGFGWWHSWKLILHWPQW